MYTFTLILSIRTVCVCVYVYMCMVCPTYPIREEGGRGECTVHHVHTNDARLPSHAVVFEL